MRNWFIYFPIPWALFIPLVLIIGIVKLTASVARGASRAAAAAPRGR